MRFTKEVLREYAKSGEDLGKWNGIRVRTCSRNELDLNSKIFWILWDLNSAVVKEGMIYGYLTPNGEVEQLEKPVRFKKEEKKEEDSDDVMRKTHQEVDCLCADIFGFNWEKWLSAEGKFMGF